MQTFVTWLSESRNLPFQQTSTVTIAMVINIVPPTTPPATAPGKSPPRKGCEHLHKHLYS